MKLTREYIKEVKFDRERKGYSIEQVDNFLDLVYEDIGALYEQIDRDKAELEKYRGMEQDLSTVLVEAQENARRTQAAAEAKAQETVRLAEAEAQQMRQDGQQQCADILAEIEKLRSFEAEYRSVLAGELSDLQDRLQQNTAAEEKWQQAPEEVRQAAAAPAFAMEEINQNLPESDEALKAMIDEL